MSRNEDKKVDVRCIPSTAKTLDVVPKAETHKLEGPMCMFL